MTEYKVKLKDCQEMIVDESEIEQFHHVLSSANIASYGTKKIKAIVVDQKGNKKEVEVVISGQLDSQKISARINDGNNQELDQASELRKHFLRAYVQDYDNESPNGNVRPEATALYKNIKDELSSN